MVLERDFILSNKLITKLRLDNEEEINKQEEILKETNFFYQKLYSAPSGQNNNDVAYLEKCII